MRVRAEVILEVDGREVYRGPSKSLVINFAKLLLAMLSAPGNTPQGTSGIIASTIVTALDSTSKYVWTEWYGSYNGGGTPMATNAPDNDSSFGVVVGSGTNPVSLTDYQLSSQIPHGTSTGQLDYDPHTVASSYSSTSSYVEIARSFVNRSGSDVVVREVGLVTRNYWKDKNAVGNDVKFLIARDVLPAPVTVKPLGSLTVRYRIGLSL